MTQREPVAENAELGDEGVQLTDVEQRIAAVILDIKSFERDPVENPDIHPIDTDDRFEFARRELRGPAHDEVLHGVDAQQQRQCKRKYDQQQTLLSNVIASQAVHMKYGGVIPELASRAHQQNIVPVVDTALKEAGVAPDELDAIAFTRGPGLLGSLLVGVSFAKGLALAHDIPMVEVNHLQGHILSHFLDLPDRTLPHPDFPFLCLLVSGGHTQIVRVDSPLEMEIVGFRD